MAHRGQKLSVKAQKELRKMELSFGIARLVVQGALILLAIWLSSVPLDSLADIVKPLAGKRTIVDVNVALSVTVAISVVLNAMQQYKIRRQRRSLQRLRQRIEERGWEDPATSYGEKL